MATKNSYTKRVVLLIVCFSFVRLMAASALELANDESYYWFLSQDVKWNYFDHPPLVAIWIRFFTANLWLDNQVVFLRLGSIAACGLSTWCMFRCVTLISSERAGWLAACLYNASFYAGITAGLLIMPDTPQMVFYTFSLWMLAKITLREDKWLYWMLFGIGSGLCIMSKAHGVFIWIGLGLYAAFIKRSWLTNIRLYAALGVALLITSPILIWNIEHNLITYRYHSDRINTKGSSLNLVAFFTAFLKQIVINNPFNVFLIFTALVTWQRIASHSRQALSIFNFIGISLAGTLLFISLYRSTLPHWSGPAYIALLPLAAIRLAALNTKRCPGPLFWSTGAYLFFLSACTLIINYYPGTFGSKTNSDLGKGDITLDMYGWREAGKKFAVIYNDEIKKGIAQKNSPVVCNTWWGAHDEYYFCRAAGIQMIGLGAINEIHEYSWMNEKRKDKVNFSTAYSIVHSDENYDVHQHYKSFYNQIDTAAVIQITRNKKPAHQFYVIRLRDWKNNLPSAKP